MDKEQLLQEVTQKLAVIKNEGELNELKAQYLGKKSPLQAVFQNMKDKSPEEKRALGQMVNEAKAALLALFEEKRTALKQAEVAALLARQAIDISLPGRKLATGSIHPLSAVIEELENTFLNMGYQIAEGPEVESDYYNFELLNLPADHPARDMQDTFYITAQTLLRTHTSPVQARTLLAAQGAPVKIICPGTVYRKDNDDATHSHQFMQIEGLVVGEKVTFADLKGTLLHLARHIFGSEREIRLRPSFFPFTEPSVEVDVSCFKCGGAGCALCKGEGWIEVLGAGMVHPNVLTMTGYDPARYQGFAFGVGVERIAMIKYGIDDIRQFYTNDLRLLSQFRR